jgi:hypothetical protein
MNQKATNKHDSNQFDYTNYAYPVKNNSNDPYPNYNPYPTENTRAPNPKPENKRKEKIEYMSYYDHFLQSSNKVNDNDDYYNKNNNNFDTDSNNRNHNQYNDKLDGHMKATKRREY